MLLINKESYRHRCYLVWLLCCNRSIDNNNNNCNSCISVLIVVVVQAIINANHNHIKSNSVIS